MRLQHNIHIIIFYFIPNSIDFLYYSHKNFRYRIQFYVINQFIHIGLKNLISHSTRSLLLINKILIINK